MAQAKSAPGTQTKAAEPQKEQEKPPEMSAEQKRNAALLDEMLNKPIAFTPFMEKEPLTLNAKMVIRFFCKPTKNGHVCSVEHAVRFMKLCQSRGLNPFVGDAYLVGYEVDNQPEFNLITSHQALLKRAEMHPHYQGMQSGVTVQDHKTFEQRDIEGEIVPHGCGIIGAWARVFTEGKKHPDYRRINLAGYNKGYSRWKSDPQGMIHKCGQAAALRQAFPNTLGGMYVEGERQDEELTQDKKDASEQLVDKLKARQTPAVNGTAVEQAKVQETAHVESQAKDEPVEVEKEAEKAPTAVEGELVDEAGPLPDNLQGRMDDWRSPENPAR